MCLHYLVKLIARVLSPYITYFCIHGVDFWHQIFTICWNNSFHQSTTVSVVFTDIHYIFFASDDVNVKGQIANVEELRQRIVDEWERLDQRIIDGATEWRKRLRACAAAEGGQFEHELWLLVQQYCCNCALWLCHLIVWLLITFAVTVFSVLWLFQLHAVAVKRYNAFCVKLTANSDADQNNISISTFPAVSYTHLTLPTILRV